jgi:ABC-type branched-subunit amino acid transport system substrate-binding protein
MLAALVSSSPEGERKMLKEYLSPQLYARLQQLGALAGKIVLPLFMVIVGLVVFKPIEDWWSGPDVYKVYLVGNKNDSETQRIFRSIQGEAALAKLKIDGREVDVEEKDDKGNITVAKEIANHLVTGSDTLMVIGHVFSQRTKQMLPAYMAATPQIPVITTRETLPSLMGRVEYCYKPGRYCPLISMSPTDVDQARSIVDFAESQGAESFLILREDDENNGDYIHGLVKGIRENIVEDRNKMGANVTAEVPILDQVSIDAAVDLTYSKHPKCVVYIGNFGIGRKYITSLRQKGTKNPETPYSPIMVLTDSSVGQDLFMGDIGPVFASYQLSGEQYLAADNVYGVDAFAMVKQLVRQVDEDPLAFETDWRSSLRHFMNVHRVKDARVALIKAMQTNADSGQPYVGLNGRTYIYVNRYSRQDSYFHVWKVDNHQITEADSHDGWAKPWPTGVVAAALTTKISSSSH